MFTHISKFSLNIEYDFTKKLIITVTYLSDVKEGKCSKL